jgi:tRNA(Ile)-lysidine synthase
MASAGRNNHNDLLEVIRRDIREKQLLPTGATIVVGVSGGADSLCLLHVLERLQSEFGWSIHIAHMNHCLRGKEADQDMLFVASLALAMGLPCTIDVTDVEALAQARHMSLEETARQARYGFLQELALQIGATAVAVGHNADDQSETVLMHVLRGSGLAGLRGMQPKRDMRDLRVIDQMVSKTRSKDVQLVRPLLSVPRSAIEAYCQLHGLSPRFDRSNLDTTFFRNRLRHELLPLLESYNPKIRASLRRAAQIAAADYELLAQHRDAAWSRLIKTETDSEISFGLTGWRALPVALQRATLRRAVFTLRPQLRDVQFTHIEQAVEIANRGDTGAQATLPQGLQMTVGYQSLRLSSEAAKPGAPGWPLLWSDVRVPVSIPGETRLPTSSKERRGLRASNSSSSSAWRLEARRWQGEKEVALSNRDRWTAYLDADRLSDDVALRRRRPGDRFQPLGMEGHSVELADFMINAKIPRRWRTLVPLLVHKPADDPQEDAIAWVVGWRIDERVKITPQTDRIIRLRWYRSADTSRTA